jgi:hypothetical protein
VAALDLQVEVDEEWVALTMSEGQNVVAVDERLGQTTYITTQSTFMSR